MGKSRIRIRVAAVIVHDGRLLLVRQTVHGGRDRWVLPGGRLDHGERLCDAARREVREETGLDVRVDKLLYVGDFMPPDKHALDVVFLAHLTGGEPTRQEDEIHALQFVPLADVPDLDVVPPSVIDRVLADAPRGFPDDAVYVGSYG